MIKISRSCFETEEVECMRVEMVRCARLHRFCPVRSAMIQEKCLERNCSRPFLILCSHSAQEILRSFFSSYTANLGYHANLHIIIKKVV